MQKKLRISLALSLLVASAIQAENIDTTGGATVTGPYNIGFNDTVSNIPRTAHGCIDGDFRNVEEPLLPFSRKHCETLVKLSVEQRTLCPTCSHPGRQRR